MTNNILAIASCRVSTLEQKKNNNSLNRQWESVLKSAESLGATIPKDAVWSGNVSSKRGKNYNRKDVREMLAYCKKHRNVKYLIIDEPDRFMRSIEEAFYWEVEFQNQVGVKIWYACDDQLNTDDMTAKLMRFMKYFVAEGSNEERIKKAINGGKKAIREGRYPYHVKLGYRPNPDKKVRGIHLVDHRTAKLLYRILSHIADGRMDITESLKIFNSSQYITSGQHRPYTIEKWKIVITDPYYCGILEVKGQVNERNENGLHEKLITKEQHLMIVERVNGRRKRHNGPRKNGNPEFPLNTITFCEKCYAEEIMLGKSLRSNRAKFVGACSTNGKTQKKYAKYKCRKCGRLINRDDLHGKVITILNTLDMTKEGRKAVTREVRKIWRLEEDDNAEEIVRLRTQVASMRRRKNELIDKISQLSSPVVLQEVEKNIEQQSNEIEQVEAKIRKIEEGGEKDRSQFIEFALEFADNLGHRFLELTPDEVSVCKQLLFPSGFFVDAEKRVYTPKISPFYRGRTIKNEPETALFDQMVIPAGVEPAIFWMRTRRPRPLDDGTT